LSPLLEVENQSTELLPNPAIHKIPHQHLVDGAILSLDEKMWSKVESTMLVFSENDASMKTI
jgi:hypothetical protein